LGALDRRAAAHVQIGILPICRTHWADSAPLRIESHPLQTQTPACAGV